MGNVALLEKMLNAGLHVVMYREEDDGPYSIVVTEFLDEEQDYARTGFKGYTLEKTIKLAWDTVAEEAEQ